MVWVVCKGGGEGIMSRGFVNAKYGKFIGRVIALNSQVHGDGLDCEGGNMLQ